MKECSPSVPVDYTFSKVLRFSFTDPVVGLFTLLRFLRFQKNSEFDLCASLLVDLFGTKICASSSRRKEEEILTKISFKQDWTGLYASFACHKCSTKYTRVLKEIIIIILKEIIIIVIIIVKCCCLKKHLFLLIVKYITKEVGK